MLVLNYNNKIRSVALQHSQRMAETSYRQGTRYFSYKHQSYNNEESGFLGKIAEILFLQWLRQNSFPVKVSPLDEIAYSDPRSNYDGDFVVVSATGTYKIELKTKSCNCEPQNDYDVGTTRISKADIYVFSRINDNNGTLWIVGFLPTKYFADKARLRPKGELVDNNTNAFNCLANEYVCQIKDLWPMKHFGRVTSDIFGFAS